MTVTHVALEDREPEVPPFDSLAEALVLDYLLTVEPARIPTTDLAGLLTYPEHRQLWACLQRAWAQQRPGDSHARFYVRWLNLAEDAQRGLSAVLDGAQSSRFEWQIARLQEDCERAVEPTVNPLAHKHDFDWWVERLRRVAAARRLIDEAQRMAELAWKGDIDEAREIAQRAGSYGQVIRINV